MIDSSNVVLVLNGIGWVFLVLSWLVPYVMRKSNSKWSKSDLSHFVGGILAAVSVGLFIGAFMVGIAL